MDKLEEWARYAKAQSHDTRIAAAVPASCDLSPYVARLSTLGVGLYVCGNDGMQEILEPIDQAFQTGIPSLRGQPHRVQKALGSSIEKCRRGHMFDGFEEGCVALEVAARKHLAASITAGRIVITSRRGVTTTASDVLSMSMGQLKDIYARIPTPTHGEQTVAAVLKTINQDRITIAHYRDDATRIGRLRKNLGNHLWLILSAMREIA